MSDNRRQHVVPQFMLKFFSDDAGLVHVCDPERRHYFKTKPINIAVENECYTLWNDGRRDTSCDEVNKKLEGWTAPRLMSWVAGSQPSREQWQSIWIMSANLLVRSRRTRDALSEQLQKVAKIAEEMAPFLREIPIPFPAVSLFGIAEFDEDDATVSSIRRLAKTHHPVTVACTIERVAHDLREKPCELLLAPSNTNFITSDDPAIILDGGESILSKIKLGFITSPNVQIIVPLTPKAAVLWGAERELKITPVTSEQVRKINELSFNSCYRQVYACRDEDFPSWSEIS